MKLTIDIKEFCRIEANAYKEGLSEKDFKRRGRKPKAQKEEA